MTEPAVSWHAEALWQQLQPLLPGLSVEVVRSTASTNTALLQRARVRPDAEGDAQVIVRRSVESAAFGRRASDWQPCLLIAEQQSAGRGRQGRGWHSQPGASLTFSLGVGLAAAEWSGLSLAIGVALCEALDPPRGIAAGASERARPRLMLKWPNDLWLVDAPADGAVSGASNGAGRKLGGILIETVTAGAQRLAIIGIGLNVREFDVAQASTGFAALQELDPVATAPGVLAQVALPLVQAVKQFEREGFAAFAARFDARDLLRGHKVRTTHPDARDGVAAGVSPQGALLMQTAGGVVTVSSGEVSVRLDAAAAAH
jgi:BirA family transcriptional regulator, biotin operon repressor / biotin---[acetyl-CoA-carboxylase] ligase